MRPNPNIKLDADMGRLAFDLAVPDRFLMFTSLFPSLELYDNFKACAIPCSVESMNCFSNAFL